MATPIPTNIRTDDVDNLSKLLSALHAPYLNVRVDTNPDYKVVDVYVRPKALPANTDIKAVVVQNPLIAQLGLEGLLEAFSGLSGVPIMVATQHVFAVLKSLAESDSYDSQMSRSGALNYARGITGLRIGSTQFRVHYSEDSGQLSGRTFEIASR